MSGHNAPMYLRRIDVTKLVRLRADRLWSQNVLAARAGVGARTIGRIETGRHDVNPVTAVKIARALEVDPDDFSSEVGALDGIVRPRRAS